MNTHWTMRAGGLLGAMALLIAMTAIVANSVDAQDASPAASPAEAAATGIYVVPGPEDGELTVFHAQGETVIEQHPETVVSFDLASIDTLEALGVEIAGAPELTSGKDRYDLSNAETVGTLFEPDYEAVAALDPDLIIVANRSSPAYEELNKIAPTIDMSFAGVNFLDELHANTTAFGEIFGKQAEAESALASIDERVAALQETIGTGQTAMIVLTSGGAVTALAPGSVGGRGALIYETLGLKPPLDDLEAATHGEPVSFEFLLEHNPDWLFVLDRDVATGETGGEAAEQVLDNDIVKEMSAYKNGHIVYLDPFDWYIIVGGGLDSTQRMLTELETAFATT